MMHYARYIDGMNEREHRLIFQIGEAPEPEAPKVESADAEQNKNITPEQHEAEQRAEQLKQREGTFTIKDVKPEMNKAEETAQAASEGLKQELEQKYVAVQNMADDGLSAEGRKEIEQSLAQTMENSEQTKVNTEEGKAMPEQQMSEMGNKPATAEEAGPAEEGGKDLADVMQEAATVATVPVQGEGESPAANVPDDRVESINVRNTVLAQMGTDIDADAAPETVDDFAELIHEQWGLLDAAVSKDGYPNLQADAILKNMTELAQQAIALDPVAGEAMAKNETGDAGHRRNADGDIVLFATEFVDGAYKMQNFDAPNTPDAAPETTDEYKQLLEQAKTSLENIKKALQSKNPDELVKALKSDQKIHDGIKTLSPEEQQKMSVDLAQERDRIGIVYEKDGPHLQEKADTLSDVQRMGKAMGEFLKMVQEFMKAFRNALGGVESGFGGPNGNPNNSGNGPENFGNSPENARSSTVSNPELWKEIQEKGLTTLRTDLDDEARELNKQLTSVDPTNPGLNKKMTGLDARENDIKSKKNEINAKLNDTPPPSAAEKVNLEREMGEQNRLLAAVESAKQALQVEIDRVQTALAQIPERRKQIETVEKDTEAMQKNIDKSLVSARNQLQAIGTPLALELSDIYNNISINRDPDTLKFSIETSPFRPEPLSQSIPALSHKIGIDMPNQDEMGITFDGATDTIQNEGALLTTIQNLSQKVIAHEQQEGEKTKQKLAKGKTLLSGTDGITATTPDAYAFNKEGVTTTFQFVNNGWEWNGASSASVPVPRDQFPITGTEVEKVAKSEANDLAEKLDALNQGN